MNELTVQTGEVKTGGKNEILKSSPIGSCVAVILFHARKKKGGMAHIMLPGKAPQKEGVIATRYADNAIEVLLQQLAFAGLHKTELKAVIVGGGNVLKRKGDTIGIENLNSVIQLLHGHKIEIKARSVKGTERKSTRFDILNGFIFAATGDEKEKLLYQIRKRPQLIA